uniref:Receptor protein serine/threonine kinase n=1 Tax=Rhabditophanes sp. KR3021 TaxID=114890 RepID=A0AC35UCV6_9BILA
MRQLNPADKKQGHSTLNGTYVTIDPAEERKNNPRFIFKQNETVFCKCSLDQCDTQTRIIYGSEYTGMCAARGKHCYTKQFLIKNRFGKDNSFLVYGCSVDSIGIISGLCEKEYWLNGFHGRNRSALSCCDEATNCNAALLLKEHSQYVTFTSQATRDLGSFTLVASIIIIIAIWIAVFFLRYTDIQKRNKGDKGLSFKVTWSQFKKFLLEYILDEEAELCFNAFSHQPPEIRAFSKKLFCHLRKIGKEIGYQIGAKKVNLTDEEKAKQILEEQKIAAKARQEREYAVRKGKNYNVDDTPKIVTLTTNKHRTVFSTEVSHIKLVVKFYPHLSNHQCFRHEEDIYCDGGYQHRFVCNYISTHSNIHGKWVVCTNYERGDLLTLLHEDTLSPKRFFRYINSLFEAMAYLHDNKMNAEETKKRIAHRDIKSSNIFISDDDFLVVGDFGYAVLEEKGEMNFVKAGTTRYCAPELLVEDDNAINVFEDYIFHDIYACGVVLTELITRIDYNKKDLDELRKAEDEKLGRSVSELLLKQAKINVKKVLKEKYSREERERMAMKEEKSLNRNKSSRIIKTPSEYQEKNDFERLINEEYRNLRKIEDARLIKADRKINRIPRYIKPFHCQSTGHPTLNIMGKITHDAFHRPYIPRVSAKTPILQFLNPIREQLMHKIPHMRMTMKEAHKLVNEYYFAHFEPEKSEINMLAWSKKDVKEYNKQCKRDLLEQQNKAEQDIRSRLAKYKNKARAALTTPVSTMQKIKERNRLLGRENEKNEMDGILAIDETDEATIAAPYTYANTEKLNNEYFVNQTYRAFQKPVPIAGAVILNLDDDIIVEEKLEKEIVEKARIPKTRPEPTEEDKANTALGPYQPPRVVDALRRKLNVCEDWETTGRYNIPVNWNNV